MDPITLRFIERFLIVIFSGMAIYLGYRLFLAVPEQRNSSGEVKLSKDISIILSRVGPGAFFALFGVIVLSLSLLRPLEFSSSASEAAQQSGAAQAYSYASEPPTRDDSALRSDARVGLRREIGRLNTIPQLLKTDLLENDRNDIIRSLRRVKLLLMKPAWGEPEEGFGDFAAFEEWVEQGEVDPPPADMKGALELYRFGSQ